nr:hypothetical protein [Alistipes sp.]
GYGNDQWKISGENNVTVDTEAIYALEKRICMGLIVAVMAASLLTQLVLHLLTPMPTTLLTVVSLVLGLAASLLVGDKVSTPLMFDRKWLSHGVLAGIAAATTVALRLLLLNLFG